MVLASERDKTFVSLIAYGGLRIGEALALDGSDVGQKAIVVSRALKLDGVGDTKTHKERLVPLLAPLAEDLAGIGQGLLFPGHDGKPWTNTAYRNWTRRAWQPACEAVGIGTIATRASGGRTYKGPTPKHLRHSCASLLLSERRNPVEVADIMGHSVQVLFSTYAHVITELRGSAPASAEAQIHAARAGAAKDADKDAR